MLTQSQAKALAAMLHELRPKWSTASMMKVLEKNAQHPAPFEDTALAAITAARDPKVDTPGCIFVDQRFWPEKAKAHIPKPPPCPDHIGQESINCRSCWADVKAGDRPETHIGTHYEAPANAGA
jgi:hypothetical protein